MSKIEYMPQEASCEKIAIHYSDKYDALEAENKKLREANKHYLEVCLERQKLEERIKEIESLFSDELIYFLEYIEANYESRTSREWIDRLKALRR